MCASCPLTTHSCRISASFKQLRVLFLETELEKRKKEKVRLSLSVSLVKGDNVGTRLIGLQGAGHVVHVCLESEGWCEGGNVEESSVEPCVMKFFGECCGWVCKHDGSLLVQCVQEFHVGWWLSSSNLERVAMRSLAICLMPGHWSRICVSVPVACWSQYRHKVWLHVTRGAFSMVTLLVWII